MAHATGRSTGLTHESSASTSPRCSLLHPGLHRVVRRRDEVIRSRLTSTEARRCWPSKGERRGNAHVEHIGRPRFSHAKKAVARRRSLPLGQREVGSDPIRSNTDLDVFDDGTRRSKHRITGAAAETHEHEATPTTPTIPHHAPSLAFAGPAARAADGEMPVQPLPSLASLTPLGPHAPPARSIAVPCASSTSHSAGFSCRGHRRIITLSICSWC